MTESPRDEGGDALRQAAQDLVRAARSFLDAAEAALDDEETVAAWASKGQEVVQSFLSGFTGSEAPPVDPDDDSGIEHIPVD